MSISSLLGTHAALRFQGALLGVIEAAHLMQHDNPQEANQILARIDKSIIALQEDYCSRESAKHLNGVTIDYSYLRVMKGVLEYGIETPEQVMQEVMAYIKKLPAPRSSLPRSRRGV